MLCMLTYHLYTLSKPVIPNVFSRHIRDMWVAKVMLPQPISKFLLKKFFLVIVVYGIKHQQHVWQLVVVADCFSADSWRRSRSPMRATKMVWLATRTSTLVSVTSCIGAQSMKM